MTFIAPHPRSDAGGDERTPVLIAGGGLVGLSAALFLAWHGVRPLLVERHPDLLAHPRARGLTPRTVELFRQIGLESAIRASCFDASEGYRWNAVQAETLAGEHVPAVAEDDGDDLAGLSPSSFAPIDQDKMEALLRCKAAALGADLRFSTELLSFEQDEGGVTARLLDRPTGAERSVRAGYLVAADGWSSPVRRQLGIGLDGPGPFFNVLTALVEADLRPALRGRQVGIAYLHRPRPGTILMARDATGCHWVFGTGYAPERGESAADFQGERCVELVRAAAGLPKVAVTIRPQVPGTDLTVLGLPIGAQVARRYRVGRVFLAGDAAHLVPPAGGFGANAGIQDAHNLAWKLAAVLRGVASPALLDTYDEERRPVGLLTMSHALARWGGRVGQGGGEPCEPPLDDAAVTLGYRYRSAAIVGAPEDPRPALPPAELTGQPGTRAPHVWLERDGLRRSTVDRFGRRFVLLTGVEGGPWLDAAMYVSGVPLDAFRIGAGGDFADEGGRWAETYGVTAGGAVLVRPDGFVAWRAARPGTEPTRALRSALAAVLAWPPESPGVAGGWDGIDLTGRTDSAGAS